MARAHVHVYNASIYFRSVEAYCDCSIATDLPMWRATAQRKTFTNSDLSQDKHTESVPRSYELASSTETNERGNILVFLKKSKNLQKHKKKTSELRPRCKL